MRVLKRSTILFAILLVYLASTINAEASSGISIFINGKKQSYSHESILEDGRTLVPLRGIFEALGASVHWNAKENTVEAYKGNKTIWLKIGSKNTKVNGKTVKIDVPAKIRNGRTLVPIRFISESLGESIQWDSKKRSIYIGNYDPNDPLRGMSFGMSYHEVKSRESALLLDSAYDTDFVALVYLVEKYGYTTELNYFFENNKLNYITYDFLPEKNNYHTWYEMVALHNMLQKHAIKEFGTNYFL